MVVPDRPTATRTGTCSFDNPRFEAFPPRLRAFRERLRSPFRLRGKNVPSASTIPHSLTAPTVTASGKR